MAKPYKSSHLYPHKWIILKAQLYTKKPVSEETLHVAVFKDCETSRDGTQTPVCTFSNGIFFFYFPQYWRFVQTKNEQIYF